MLALSGSLHLQVHAMSAIGSYHPRKACYSVDPLIWHMMQYSLTYRRHP